MLDRVQVLQGYEPTIDVITMKRAGAQSTQAAVMAGIRAGQLEMLDLTDMVVHGLGGQQALSMLNNPATVPWHIRAQLVRELTPVLAADLSANLAPGGAFASFFGVAFFGLLNAGGGLAAATLAALERCL